jgi:hypothetical protein
VSNPESDVHNRGLDTDNLPTRVLLVCGALAGPLFTQISLDYSDYSSASMSSSALLGSPCSASACCCRCAEVHDG